MLKAHVIEIRKASIVTLMKARNIGVRNILLQETFDIAINLIFNHNPNLNTTRKELTKFFFFAPSHAHFIFHSRFYNHIDGVAMGSP